MSQETQRIAKVLAAAGVASRRAAEVLIQEGRVVLNGAVVTTPATFVGPNDQLSVDGQNVALKRELPRFFLYHKPAGLVTTHKDPEGRPTVFASLPNHLPRVVSVGRLDQNSEGLLLLTTHGGLVRLLEHPSAGLGRVYRVRVYGPIPPRMLDQLRAGLEVEGVVYRGIDATILSRSGANTWLEMTLKEGKNREIRRLMTHFGLRVSRLIRVSYGPFHLHDLKVGEVMEMPYPLVKQHLRRALALDVWETLP